MIVKIVFWLFFLGSFFSAVRCAQDHPRTRKKVNLVEDVLELIEKMIIAYFLGHYLWG